ncbi:MAG: SPOR domain-containing protein [Paludibacter sp.]|nr:SPOR domain-containing protein [Bacteroidales bacterium]MCM1068634.1 SPOR domain-containing protein [Prevotella sp.]MCM1353298.1 SPOR domain-containing protein [Bacteroides sp.]MCM1442294.1 SPOR domain-containing protein [Muribaculum sp.]MCM1481113.1 SPOR domain-containing protein [Paludibacter sp.]
MKKNRIGLFLLGIVCSAVFVQANDSIPVEQNRQLRIVDAMSRNVQVHSAPLVDRLLLDKINGINREQVQVQGYRVQVFSGNQQQTAKTEAFRVEKLISESTIESPTYVLYNPPFWKVRVGNFRTQEEAQLMKEEIIRILPELQGETYVVRDQIQVIQ